MRTQNNLLIFLVLGMAILGANSCVQKPKLRPFTSDGCSLFPDKDYWEGGTWCHCCVAHDLKYWKGGPLAERIIADQELKECVMEATGDEALAKAMYMGTRSGGGDLFPTSYRWGYGWPYKLSEEISPQNRTLQIQSLEPQNLDSLVSSFCGS